MKKIPGDTSDYEACEAANGMLRRFVKAGTGEDMAALEALVREKGLSREDLELILRTIRPKGKSVWEPC